MLAPGPAHLTQDLIGDQDHQRPSTCRPCRGTATARSLTDKSPFCRTGRTRSPNRRARVPRDGLRCAGSSHLPGALATRTPGSIRRIVKCLLTTGSRTSPASGISSTRGKRAISPDPSESNEPGGERLYGLRFLAARTAAATMSRPSAGPAQALGPDQRPTDEEVASTPTAARWRPTA